jgi:hypothetical protein
MPHPYLTRRTEVFGFFAIICLFLAFATGTSDPSVVRLRFRFIGISDPASLHIMATAFAVAGVFLLAVAVFIQVRYGPKILEVHLRPASWPPRGWRLWFNVGILAFVFVLMAIVVIIHFFALLMKT